MIFFTLEGWGGEEEASLAESVHNLQKQKKIYQKTDKHLLAVIKEICCFFKCLKKELRVGKDLKKILERERA